MLLVDKSVIDGLSWEHWSLIHRFYSPVICPILMQELLADLAKRETIDEGKRLVSRLAGKAQGDSWVLPDARRLAIASLLGKNIPLNGRIPTFNGVLVRNKRGEIGHILDEPYEQKVLRRWQSQEFSVDEHEQAKFLRATSVLDFGPLQRQFRSAHKGKLKFSDLAELVSWLDQEMIERVPDRIHFLRLTNTLSMSKSHAKRAYDSWKNSGLRLSEYAKYAFYSYRTSLIFGLGVAFEKIPSGKSAKSHLDAEYLLYLPFSMAFASGDRRVHELLVPFLLRPDQTFLYKDDLQKDLKAINEEWGRMQASGVRGLGFRPPKLKDSLTAQVWEKLSPHSEHNSDDAEDEAPISPEVEKTTVAEIMDITENSFRILDGKRFKETKHHQAIRELTLEQRNIILLDLMEVAFGLKSGKTLDEVRRSFGAKEVKDFYNAYADVWPPDTDFLSMLKRPSDRARSIVYSDFSSEVVEQTVNSLPLYFDEVMAPDPAHFPWNMKREMNPIASPDQFIEDTYKILFGVLFAAPLISCARFFLAPDIMNFNREVRRRLLDLGKKRFSSVKFGKRDMKASERMMKRAYFISLAKLEDSDLRRQLSKNGSPMSGDDLESFMRFLRKRADMDILNLPNHKLSSDGDLMAMRSGGNLEQMILMSNLTNSVPITESDTKISEVRAVSAGQSMLHEPLILTLPMFSSNEPLLFEVLRDEKPFRQFRKLFSEFLQWRSSGSKKLNSTLAAEVLEISRDLLDSAPKIENMLQQEKKQDDNYFAQNHGNLTIELRTLNDDFLNTVRECMSIVNPGDSVLPTILFGESLLKDGFELIDIFS